VVVCITLQAFSNLAVTLKEGPFSFIELTPQLLPSSCWLDIGSNLNLKGLPVDLQSSPHASKLLAEYLSEKSLNDYLQYSFETDRAWTQGATLPASIQLMVEHGLYSSN
jgi:hypothetical protein